MEPIINRVAQSDIIVYNLESLWEGAEVAPFDLAPFLLQGLVLREKDFREAMKTHDWQQYAGKHVAVHCSTDAIVPTWAFMLVASKLAGTAHSVGAGQPAEAVRNHFVRALEQEDWSKYEGRIVVIKGCGSKVVPLDAYIIATQKLQAVVAKLMYGEPCSSVPLWRKPKQAPADTVAAAKAVVPARPAIPARE